MQDRKRNFRVVQGTKDNNLFKRVLANIESEAGKLASRIKTLWATITDEKTRRKSVITISVVVILILLGTSFLLQKYENVKVVKTYEIVNATDSKYRQFSGGILKYGRDGISFLSKKGEEQWNYPYQMKLPTVDINGNVALVADIGGNTIKILETKGLRGEIETNFTIEKAEISKTGIVAAILSNETTPKIVCYDSAGNILVEHQSSVTGTGYPLDLSISDDGNILQVLYAKPENSGLNSRIVHYNFGASGESEKDYIVSEKENMDILYVDGFFLGKGKSVVVGDCGITFFQGDTKPQECQTVAIDGEIQGIDHNDKYVAVLYKENGSTNYVLKMYDVTGKEHLSVVVDKRYKNLKITKRGIILYEGKQCAVYTMHGRQKFSGEMPQFILEVIPKAGLGSYYVVDADGIEIERLSK